MSKDPRVNDNRWLLIGVGLLLLFVAYVSRGGTDPDERSLNPLPWLFLGLAFVVGGSVAHRLRRH
jgi:uncharacterized membrane protein